MVWKIPHYSVSKATGLAGILSHLPHYMGYNLQGLRDIETYVKCKFTYPLEVSIMKYCCLGVFRKEYFS